MLKISIIVNLCLSIVLSGILVLFFYEKFSREPSLELLIKSQSKESLQLFCNTGNGFNESESSATNVGVLEGTGELIKIPITGVCRALRLDIGGNNAVVLISEARILTNGGKKIDILSSLADPAYLNQIDFVKNTGELIYKSVGKDPFIILSGDFTKILEKN